VEGRPEADLDKDWRQVAGYTLQGLKGYSTAFVPLTYTPEQAGPFEYKIAADNYNNIKQQPVVPERPASEYGIPIHHGQSSNGDGGNPNDKMADSDMLAVLYSSNDDWIPVQAKFYHSSAPSVLLGPDQNVSARYILKLGAEIKREGQLNYLAATGLFSANIPIAVLSSGTYTLTIEGSEGGAATLSETVNIRIIQTTIATVSTDRSAYQIGDEVRISGNFTFSDGNPMANETVVLDLKLLPRLTDPRIGRDERGNEVLLQYQGEHIRFLKTDQYGNFNYSFYPRYGEAGQWEIDVFAFQRLLGNAASTAFAVKGMVAEPSSVEITAVKNSTFAKTITFKNAALAGDNALTGLTAVLTKVGDNNVVATLDTTNFSRTLLPGSSTTVVVNFSAPLNADDTASFKLEVTAADGTKATSNIKLNLRPATPIPVTDPKGVKCGLNPGREITKTIKLTNKGLGEFNAIRLEQPVNVPWIKLPIWAKSICCRRRVPPLM
jgi:hypothetical protein